MKRIFATIVVMLVLFSTMGFGAERASTTLDLSAVVTGVNEIGVYKTVQSNPLGTSLTAIDLEDLDLNTDEQSATYYLAVRTNLKGASQISIEVDSLIGEDYADELIYSLELLVAEDNTTASTTASTAVTLTEVIRTIDAGTGLRVYNFPFRYNIPKENIQAVSPDTYKANITFTFSAP